MKKKTIFIVEDSAVIGGMLLIQLNEYLAYDVQWFQTGEDMLKVLEHTIPDAIVLDYYLNNENHLAMDGLALMRKVNDIPVVVLSGQKDLTIATRFIQKGAVDYIRKDDDLIENVEKTLKRLFLAIDAKIEKKAIQFKNQADLLRIIAIFLITISLFVVTINT